MYKKRTAYEYSGSFKDAYGFDIDIGLSAIAAHDAGNTAALVVAKSRITIISLAGTDVNIRAGADIASPSGMRLVTDHISFDAPGNASISPQRAKGIEISVTTVTGNKVPGQPEAGSFVLRIGGELFLDVTFLPDGERAMINRIDELAHMLLHPPAHLVGTTDKCW